MSYKPIIGTRYNQYVVISEEFKVGSGGRMFEVKCDCGKIDFKLAKHLATGRCKSCKSCACKKTASKYPPPRNDRSIGELGRVYYSSLRFGAQRRNLEFKITQQHCWDLFLLQNKKCALSGVEITLSNKIKDGNADYTSFTASLDRIDSNLGYIKGNVQWVHRDINWMKNNFNQDVFINVCCAVADHQRHANQQPSTSGMV